MGKARVSGDYKKEKKKREKTSKKNKSETS